MMSYFRSIVTLPAVLLVVAMPIHLLSLVVICVAIYAGHDGVRWALSRASGRHKRSLRPWRRQSVNSQPQAWMSQVELLFEQQRAA
jgi:hypothetical protein